MADLRALLERLGCTDVATYLQSGNAVVTSAKGATLAGAVSEELGVDVLIRTAAQLTAVVTANPFTHVARADPTKVAVAFLSSRPDKARYDAIDHASFAPDEIELGKDVLYVHYPNGQGRATLKPAVLSRLGVVSTVRNWRTVEALARMSST